MTTATVDHDGVLVRTEREERCEIESLDQLHADRRKAVRELGPLAAKFRSGGNAGADSTRKRHRALIAKRILADWPKDQKEPSEAALERMANADDEHVTFCDELEADFVKVMLLENEVAELTERIRNREEEMRQWRAESGLAR